MLMITTSMGLDKEPVRYAIAMRRTEILHGQPGSWRHHGSSATSYA